MQAHCDLMSLSENVLYYMALLDIASGPASPCQGIGNAIITSSLYSLYTLKRQIQVHYNTETKTHLTVHQLKLKHTSLL